MRDEISREIANNATVHRQIVASLPTGMPSCLISPMMFMTERKIKATIETLSTQLNSNQYQLLVRDAPKLVTAILKLAEVCDFSSNEINLIATGDEDTWRGYSLSKLLRTYIDIRIVLEKYLLEIYGPLNDLYSYYQVPNRKVQSLFINNTEELVMGDELTFIDVEGSGKKTDGYPDLNKFKQYEQQEYFLGLELSVASQLIVADDYFTDILPTFGGSGLREIVSEILEEMYLKTFRFIYEQIYANKYTWQQIKANTIQKYQNFFLTSLVSKIKQVAADEIIKELLVSEQDLITELLAELENGVTQVTDLFDLEAPRIYRVELRENTEFEAQQLKSFFSADVYLYESVVGYKDVLVDCYSLGYSMLNYKLIGELLN
jgi:hypothetical protein